jgi:hypothetical protein
MQKQLFKLGFLYALGQGVYIFFVALLMRNAERYLSGTPDNILAPITFLTLFVLSAAISGALVLGKPALLYMEGKKKEALQLFGFTLLWLFIFFAVLVVSLMARR